MKRLGSSDSIGALMSICPPTEEQSPGGGDQVYSREFQSMLDGLDDEGCCLEESGHVAEKKRRLSVDQVKALEKSFEVENKLEPERKVKLAQELGLQPRQVAVWFQNRRARWKTKQLERDYGVLKANFDALKHNFDSLRQDNEALLEQIRVLRSKLDEENSESNVSIKEDEALIFKSCHKIKEETNAVASPVADCLAGSEANYKTLKNHNVSSKNSFLADLKEGLSDSDSSAILNDDNSMNPASSTQNQQLFISSSPTSSSFRFNTFLNSKYSETEDPALATAKVVYQPHFVKMEEHNFFGGEETCNFFSDEQAPSLHWYSPDQWT